MVHLYGVCCTFLFLYFPISVGSGSSGSAVVHRLAMDKHNYKVLLLEVGGNQFPLSGVPALLFELLNNPEIDWSDVIVPQKKACKAFKNDVRLTFRSDCGKRSI